MSLVQAPPVRIAAAPAPPPVNAADVAHTLRRHLGRIGAITALFTLGALLFVLFSTPRFDVSGSLFLGDAPGHSMTAPTAYDGLGMPTNFETMSDVATQVELLSSASLIEQAILETGLNAPVRKAGVSPPSYAQWLLFQGHSVQAFAPRPGDVEALYARCDQPATGKMIFRITIGANGDYTISRLGLFGGGVLLKGQLGTPASGGGLSLLLKPAVTGAPPAPGAAFDMELTPAALLAAKLQDDGVLKIAADGNLVDPTNVASLSLLSATPYAAQRFLDQLMNDFIATQLEWKTRSASDTADYIAQQISAVKQSLATADAKLAAYQAQTGILDVPGNAQAIITQLSQYEAQRTGLALQLDALKKLQSEMQNAAGGVNPYLVSETNDNVLTQMASNLSAAEVQLQTLNVQYTGSMVDVQKEQATIAQIEDAMRNLVANDLTLATANLAKMDAMIAQYNEQLKAMPQESLEVVDLTRSTQVYSQIYTLLMQKAEEANVTKASTVTNTRIASLAEVPLRPDTPRPLLTVFAGMAMGLLTGVALALAKRAASGRLQTEDEVTRLAPLPVYGLLPKHRRRPPENGVFMDRSQDPFTESMRFVRDCIYQAHVGEGGCVLLITSATSGDGKTEVALNLARSLADDGKKTILVDADLRRSMENKIFKTAPESRTDAVKTIANMAVQTTTPTGLADWVATTRMPQFEKYPKQEFYMLPSGPLPLNPVELMNRRKFGEALGSLRKKFEYVVIDSPPLPAVADGLTLAKHADIVLSVVRPGHTGRETFIAHNEMLGRLGRTRGLIVNEVVKTSYGYGYGDGFESQFRAGKAGKGRMRQAAEKIWRAASR
jgi:capsular exopolysaccharide synthesis family protein